MAKSRSKKPTAPAPTASPALGTADHIDRGKESPDSPLDHPEYDPTPVNAEEVALATPEAIEEAARQLQPLTKEQLTANDPVTDDIARRTGPDLTRDEPAQGDNLDEQPQHHRQQHQHGRRSIIGDNAGDARVVLNDEGNYRGLGIQFDFATPQERPSDTVKQVLRDGEFRWNQPRRQWSKRIDQANPVRSRLDAEGTFAETVKQLRHEKEGPGF